MLFKTSLSVKRLPEDWSSANVVPVFKKGDKKEALNYRPISLTFIICQMLESIVRDHIMAHFVDNQLFSTQQFGFRPSADYRPCYTHGGGRQTMCTG